MKKHLFPLFLLLLGANTYAQRDFFAITGKNTQSIDFNNLREIEGTSGTTGRVIFSADITSKVFSQKRNRIVVEDKQSYSSSQAPAMAALAYDFSDNRLVYMPMFSSNIYVLNLETKEITLIENNVATVSSCDINSHITRMTAGYDGNIYAVNNSGTQFLQIQKKNGQYLVHDLGMIKDEASNGKNSFTALETGFGGDMVAGADHNFYIFAASGNVFKISIQDMTARFIGKIAGIPEHYSVNGSAVNDKGNVVIASAKGAPLYEVNLETLQAVQLPGEKDLHIYDLASKYFVNNKSAPVNFSTIDIYPTRVDEQFINIRINNKNIKGNIRMNVFDLSGKQVMNENLIIKEETINQKIYFNNLAEGAYLVNITDDSGKVILNKKILITK
ncbi:T9SS type A sorting domain-containing protein [Chryseobacterium flavum]|uniref:T9SS type A sorting domain-containing protein n=1 Tax=Chryseobacterium flavum TaxID=415851 RepID=UPI0028A9E479|nr:T9SS type A sorting domain-containing protein [Chryseobacterium flavum]